MKVNIKKTEVRVCSKYYESISIKMDDNALKQVSTFKYLSSTFTEDGKNKEDIIQRINPLAPDFFFLISAHPVYQM